MATYGPNPPSATAVDGSGIVWVNPSYVYASGNYAYLEPWNVVTVSETVTEKEAANGEVAKWTGFGFSVPTDYSVTMVKVSIWRYQTNPHYSGTDVKDLSLKLVVGGAATGENKASSVAWSSSLTQYDYEYTPTEWGVSNLTPAQVNASNFGIAFSIKGTGGPVPYPGVPPVAPIGYVDLVKITITAEPNLVRVDSVSAKWCYDITSAIPGQDGGVGWEYVSFSPLRKLRAIRNSGHIDEIEWNSEQGAYIEGDSRDGGYEMPDGYWESSEIRGENSRIAEVGVDREEGEAVDVTVTSDRGAATNTLTADLRYTRFGTGQQGWNHKLKVAVTEATSAIQRIAADVIRLSQGLKR